MASVHKHAIVPYSAPEMYALVNDIEAYPQFLPWCRSTKILSRKPDEIRATIQIQKGPLQKAFTTSNRLHQDKMIDIRLVDGPFKRLDGYWRFDTLSEKACRVSLDMNFEFASGLMSMAVGPVFHQIANSLVDAFCQRAVTVYGRR